MTSTQLLAMPPVQSGGVDARPVAELLAAIDDRSAWTELVERFGRLVWSVARSFRFDDATTADVTQAVWLRLVEKRLEIREPERLASWLATTTRREAITVQRTQRREFPVERLVETDDPVTVPIVDSVVDKIDDAALRAAVMAAFLRLSEEHQRLLRLLTAEPKIEYGVIAEIVGRPVGSIGPTRGRCLTELRRHLDDLKGEQP